jgi:hypothetical protein
VFATRVTTNPSMTMEIDLASDRENGALDSEDSGNSYPRRGYEFPGTRASLFHENDQVTSGIPEYIQTAAHTPNIKQHLIQ